MAAEKSIDPVGYVPADYSEGPHVLAPAASAARGVFVFERRPARWLGVILTAVHAAAGLSVWAGCPWPWASMAATCAIGLSLAWELRKAGTPLQIRLEAGDGQASAVTLGGRRTGVRRATLHASTFVSPYLVILRVREAGRRSFCSSILVPRLGRADDAHRRLRVWLRWAARVGRPIPHVPAGEPSRRAPVHATRR